MKLTAPVLCVVFALIVVGCTTLPQGNAAKTDIAKGARQIFGTSLIGAHGKTQGDQDKIDDAMAGACAVGVYSKAECQRHHEAND